MHFWCLVWWKLRLSLFEAYILFKKKRKKDGPGQQDTRLQSQLIFQQLISPFWQSVGGSLFLHYFPLGTPQFYLLVQYGHFQFQKAHRQMLKGFTLQSNVLSQHGYVHFMDPGKPNQPKDMTHSKCISMRFYVCLFCWSFRKKEQSS